MRIFGKLLGSGYFYVVMTVGAILFFPFCLATWLLSFWWDPKRRWTNFFSCAWGSFVVWMNPLWRIEIHGREKIDSSRPVLLVCNHQSSFDVYLLYRLFKPFHWVSKRSNFKVPFIGWNMILMRTIGFNRGDNKETLKMVKQCINRLREGISILIFPEGERSPDGRLRPFLGGAFAVAKKARVPIQPIVVSGTYAILPRGHSLVRPAGQMRLEVLDSIPIEAVEENSAEELSQLVRCRMMGALPPEALPEAEDQTQESAATA